MPDSEVKHISQYKYKDAHTFTTIHAFVQLWGIRFVLIKFLVLKGSLKSRMRIYIVRIVKCALNRITLTGVQEQRGKAFRV